MSTTAEERNFLGPISSPHLLWYSKECGFRRRRRNQHVLLKRVWHKGSLQAAVRRRNPARRCCLARAGQHGAMPARRTGLARRPEHARSPSRERPRWGEREACPESRPSTACFPDPYPCPATPGPPLTRCAKVSPGASTSPAAPPNSAAPSPRELGARSRGAASTLCTGCGWRGGQGSPAGPTAGAGSAAGGDSGARAGVAIFPEEHGFFEPNGALLKCRKQTGPGAGGARGSAQGRKLHHRRSAWVWRAFSIESCAFPAFRLRFGEI